MNLESSSILFSIFSFVILWQWNFYGNVHLTKIDFHEKQKFLFASLNVDCSWWYRCFIDFPVPFWMWVGCEGTIKCVSIYLEMCSDFCLAIFRWFYRPEKWLLSIAIDRMCTGCDFDVEIDFYWIGTRVMTSIFWTIEFERNFWGEFYILMEIQRCLTAIF